jgi:hypothetical protein
MFARRSSRSGNTPGRPASRGLSNLRQPGLRASTAPACPRPGHHPVPALVSRVVRVTPDRAAPAAVSPPAQATAGRDSMLSRTRTRPTAWREAPSPGRRAEYWTSLPVAAFSAARPLPKRRLRRSAPAERPARLGQASISMSVRSPRIIRLLRARLSWVPGSAAGTVPQRLQQCEVACGDLRLGVLAARSADGCDELRLAGLEAEVRRGRYRPPAEAIAECILRDLGR